MSKEEIFGRGEISEKVCKKKKVRAENLCRNRAVQHVAAKSYRRKGGPGVEKATLEVESVISKMDHT